MQTQIVVRIRAYARANSDGPTDECGEVVLTKDGDNTNYCSLEIKLNEGFGVDGVYIVPDELFDAYEAICGLSVVGARTKRALFKRAGSKSEPDEKQD